jgi:hypothetical protein
MFSFRHLLQLAGRVALMLLAIGLLLEIVTRLAWWNDRPLALFDRQIMLLPLPLATEAQIEILEEWSKDTNTYLQFDPILGWSIKPSVTAEWEGHSYTSNSIGLRSLREYSLVAPEGVTRLAAFGPSFTHGDEVQGDETWEAQLEQARPDLEVMNWGVGGYGTDQAFLRYQTQGAAYRPDIVIIGFEEDNLSRNVNRFRPFFRPGTGLPLTKPVFVDGENGLVLVENPFDNFETFQDTLLNQPDRFLDMLCPHDFFCQRDRYQPLGLDAWHSFRFFRTFVSELEQPDQSKTSLIQEPYVQRVNFLLIQMFVEEVVRNGSIPLVLIFPELSSIQTHEAGGVTDYAAAVTLLREQNIQVIDLAPAFAHDKTSQNRIYADYYASEGGHFSALGNRVVAETLLWHLCSQGLLTSCP